MDRGSGCSHSSQDTFYCLSRVYGMASVWPVRAPQLLTSYLVKVLAQKLSNAHLAFRRWFLYSVIVSLRGFEEDTWRAVVLQQLGGCGGDDALPTAFSECNAWARRVEDQHIELTAEVTPESRIGRS